MNPKFNHVSIRNPGFVGNSTEFQCVVLGSGAAEAAFPACQELPTEEFMASFMANHDFPCL